MYLSISIKKHVKVDVRFEFSPITAEDISKEISLLDQLDPKKNDGCIPTKLLKELRHVVSKPLAEVWNTQLIRNKTFSGRLKLGDITPVFKALQNTTKKNYRSITVYLFKDI